IDKITIGNGRRGPVTEAIQNEFFGIVTGERPDVHDWLTYVYEEGSAEAIPMGSTVVADID
ncbi:MAG TPA: hypothetical protein VKE92_11300, partial [Anaerolineales bacterium]|nr:hypothetical protein [Anaerolineales bacterium]